MNCIFCKEISDSSKSVEHIIPESLGNKEFILERGVVCDKCNNYIAVKIEQPLLELPYFKQFRHDLNIQNKKGKIPSKKGFLIDPDYSEVTFNKHKDKGENIEIEPFQLDRIFEEGFDQVPAFILTFGPPLENVHLSRFLAKVSIEATTYETIKYGYDELRYTHPCFDNLKRFVRQAQKNEFWNYATRSIYNPDHGFKDDTGYLKVISSWAFIVTSDYHLLFQLLFIGTEFTIDMLSAGTESIERWDKENGNRSVVFENVFNQFGGKA